MNTRRWSRNTARMLVRFFLTSQCLLQNWAAAQHCKDWKLPQNESRVSPGSDMKFVDFLWYLLVLSLSCAYPLATSSPIALSTSSSHTPSTFSEPCLVMMSLSFVSSLWSFQSVSAMTQCTRMTCVEMTLKWVASRSKVRGFPDVRQFPFFFFQIHTGLYPVPRNYLVAGLLIRLTFAVTNSRENRLRKKRFQLTLSEVSVHHDGVGVLQPSGSQHGGQVADRENVRAGFFLFAVNWASSLWDCAALFPLSYFSLETVMAGSVL